MTVRLDRALRDARPGWSRTDAAKAISAGRVSVNGSPVRIPDTKVDAEKDRLTLDGQVICSKQFRTYMMNKPAGVLSATEDRSCETVLDLLSPEVRKLGLSPAGRLDKDAEGLLILSNDGNLVHRIISPQSGIWKRYLVVLRDPGKKEYNDAFQKGIAIDEGYVCLPARFYLGDKENEGIVEVHEGKFHQVKRMLHAVGNEVLYLKRLSVGGLVLDPDLASGAYRELTDVEIHSLFING